MQKMALFQYMTHACCCPRESRRTHSKFYRRHGFPIRAGPLPGGTYLPTILVEHSFNSASPSREKKARKVNNRNSFSRPRKARERKIMRSRPLSLSLTPCLTFPSFVEVVQERSSVFSCPPNTTSGHGENTIIYANPRKARTLNNVILHVFFLFDMPCAVVDLQQTLHELSCTHRCFLLMVQLKFQLLILVIITPKLTDAA